VKKSEFRQISYHFELQNRPEIDPGTPKDTPRNYTGKRQRKKRLNKPVLAREREARFKKESLPNMFSTVMWT
jgi:hypothetical protein